MAAMVVDPATGTRSAVQTITTLPDGYTARNTCSQIHITSSGQFLYVANLGHNSIAGFAVPAARPERPADGQSPANYWLRYRAAARLTATVPLTFTVSVPTATV